MKLTETILHKAAPYPLVAFDVFDTLIKRDVARPTDLFALLGADFAKARIQAEAEARAAKSGEVPGGGNLFSGGRNPDKCNRDPGIFKALRGGYCSGYRTYRCPRGRCN